MNKDVKITIETTQKHESEKQKMQHVYEGKYFLKGNDSYVFYEDTEKNRLRFSREFLEVVKKGAINSTMFFKENKSHSTEYHTPFGMVSLQIHTRKYRMKKLGEDQILMEILYDLGDEGGVIAQCDMRIEIIFL